MVLSQNMLPIFFVLYGAEHVKSLKSMAMIKIKCCKLHLIAT